MVSLEHYIVLSLALFAIGAAGVIVRRNALIMLMSVELMLNSVNLVLVAFSRLLHGGEGEAFVFFIIAMAAVEVAVGLAIVVLVFRNRRTVDADDLCSLKG
jgi:NADH-quinone oxidoreductase subunit K